MKVSELIEKLQELKAAHGDIPVVIPNWEFLQSSKIASVEYIKELDDVLHSCHAEDTLYPLIFIDS